MTNVKGLIMKAKTTLGNNVKRLRHSCGMTQEGVALLLGTSKQYVSNIETGKQWVSASRVDKLCEIFAVTLDEFFISKERLDSLNSLLFQEIELMDQSKRARLYSRAIEINTR